MADRETIDWLLAGDPSVVWQTQRDLLGLPADDWKETRSRVGTEGWGRQLLDRQDADGRWGGGLYGPKWTSTTYTLLLLRRLGLDPRSDRAVAGARVLLDEAAWVGGGVSYHVGHPHPEKCINGMVLSIASYFDVDDTRLNDIAAYLLGGRLEDGAWNCRDYQPGVRHSSFHTTISVLEGLLLWKRRTGRNSADTALESGIEFMLNHHMFRSHTTGEVINEAWTKFSFPPRWYYDVLRGLDHMRDVGAARDRRAEEAIGLLHQRRRSDGLWPIGPRYSGEVFFRMESGRNPGRWNTLRALRVLGWWES